VILLAQVASLSRSRRRKLFLKDSFHVSEMTVGHHLYYSTICDTSHTVILFQNPCINFACSQVPSPLKALEPQLYSLYYIEIIHKHYVFTSANHFLECGKFFSLYFPVWLQISFESSVIAKRT
jgi:hypothetical protein